MAQKKDRSKLILLGIVIFEIFIIGFIVAKVYLGSAGFHFSLP